MPSFAGAGAWKEPILFARSPRHRRPVALLLLGAIGGRLLFQFAVVRTAFPSQRDLDRQPDSDGDLLVVVPDESPAVRAASRLGYQALRGTGVAADVVVWRRESFERRTQVRTSLPYAALHEGVVLVPFRRTHSLEELRRRRDRTAGGSTRSLVRERTPELRG